MNKVSLRGLLAAALVALSLTSPAGASHNSDLHSDNMSLVAHYDEKGQYQNGSDIAFWGDMGIFGNTGNPGGFRILDLSDPTDPTLIGQFPCAGSQSDVSVWEDLVFVAVDAPQQTTDCGGVGTESWEGIRVVSIENPAKPEQLAAVQTDCGAHTGTMLPDPDNNRVLVFAMSYPLGAPTATCNVATHRKVSIVEVPLDKPETAALIGSVDVSPAIGCHDVTFFPERQLAAAACISESQVWDVTDLDSPTVMSHIPNPLINIHHTAQFSWDGNTMVVGDELGGAAVSPGCGGDTGGGVPVGAFWFYDVTDPALPVLQSFYQNEHMGPENLCTAHNGSVIPLKGDTDILVAAWYEGGTTVVDFTDPANPTEIGYYIPQEGPAGDALAGNSWSSYWYNGYIYANNLGSRGIDVFAIDHPDLAESEQLFLSRLNPQTQEPLSLTVVDPGAGGGACAVAGTAKNDVLVGTNGDEQICGAAGNDTIRGKGGDDELLGQAGKDKLLGGAGEDLLNGGPGRDSCRGGTSSDRFRACEQKRQ